MRRRSSRRAAELPSLPPQPPYIKRKLAHYNPLDEETLVALEAQIDWILQDVGIAFRDDPVAIDLWKEAGVTVEGDIIRGTGRLGPQPL